VEWWEGNKRRTSERDVDIRERDVVVRFIRAGRAVVVVDVVDVLQDVSVDRTDKWRVRAGRAVVEAILLGELDGHLQQARRREK
jgi:hypothetical protein